MQFKRKLSPKRRHYEEMTLQITSMADIFMIIIVFLLKTFSTGALDISASSNLTLPVSSQAEEVKDALKLEITANTILVNSKPTISMNAFKADNEELDQAGGFKKLTTALSAERAKMAESGSRDLASDASVLVLADQKVPYRILKSVIASGAQNGFTDLRLVVVEDQ